MSEEPPVAVSPEEVHAHPKHTGRFRVDLIIALTAILLSVISLAVAIEHGRTQRDLVAASTWPFASTYIKRGANSEGDVQFGLVNSGVGPAKIESFEVYFKGKPVSSPLDLLRRCCNLPSQGKALEDAVNGWVFSITSNNIVLRSGDEVAVMTVRPNPANGEMAKKFSKAIGDLDFRACYCSVLDECWASDLSSSWAHKVKECRPAAHPFDPNGR